MIPLGTVPDAWAVLSSIASLTEKVQLGTCVSDPHRRHPAVFAQTVATVDQISKGRVIVGLGSGEAMNTQQFGISWDKPVSRMVEFTEIVRKLWQNDRVTYSGRFWQIKDGLVQIKPVRNPVPIYFAANGPKTRKLAGEIANGWLPTPQSPELYRKHLREIKEAADNVGRSFDDFEPGLYVYTAMAERYDDALEQLKRIKPQIAFFPKIIEEAGYSVEIPEHLSKNLYSEILLNEDGLKKYNEFGKYIPDEVVEDFSIVGTPEGCATKVQEFVKAGVKHFILINMGPDPKYVLDVFANRIIPQYRNARTG
jgi:alkanesulfonate monooxygenase SsuD/methylene tetrahydromethanopterin reductase-like flavin-dependent oxidoreductase (luciferase family)